MSFQFIAVAQVDGEAIFIGISMLMIFDPRWNAISFWIIQWIKDSSTWYIDDPGYSLVYLLPSSRKEAFGECYDPGSMVSQVDSEALRRPRRVCIGEFDN